MFQFKQKKNYSNSKTLEKIPYFPINQITNKKSLISMKPDKKIPSIFSV
jgi:hypothetical protein